MWEDQRRLHYNKLNKTGDKVEKEQIESNQIEKVSNLFKTISISEYLESLNVQKGIDKQKADDLVIDEPTIAEDIDDYIDESNAENVLSIEEVDEKTPRIEVLWTGYRRRYNEHKVLLGSNYEESCAEDGKEKLASVKNYIMKANMVKKDKGGRK